MAKNSWIMPVVLIGGAAIWYTQFNGKATIDNLINDLKSKTGSGGGGSDIGVNVSGLPTVDGINSQVQDMMNKIKGGSSSKNNYNYQSGPNSQVNRQSNTGKGGQITQKHSVNQKSTSFFTVPYRLGNL